MAQNTTPKSGDQFLPDYTEEQLREMQKDEDNPKAALRLQAWIMYKGGSSIRSIGRNLNLSHSTIYTWLVRARTRGIDGRYDKKAPGNKCKLDSGQLEELKADITAGAHECGFESGTWTGLRVGWHIERKYGVKYSGKAVYNLLKRLGFSCRFPRPEHHKSASKEDQDKFKRPAPRPASTRNGDTRQ